MFVINVASERPIPSPATQSSIRAAATCEMFQVTQTMMMARNKPPTVSSESWIWPRLNRPTPSCSTAR